MYYQNQYFDGSNYNTLIPKTSHNCLTLNGKTESDLQKNFLASNIYRYENFFSGTIAYTYDRTNGSQNNITIPAQTDVKGIASIIYFFYCSSFSISCYRSSQTAQVYFGFSLDDYPGYLRLTTDTSTSMSNTYFRGELFVDAAEGQNFDSFTSVSYFLSTGRQSVCYLAMDENYKLLNDISFFNPAGFLQTASATRTLSVYIKYFNI